MPLSKSPKNITAATRARRKRNAWTRTDVRGIYMRGAKYYFVRMIRGKRDFALLRDAAGLPVTTLSDAIRAAAAHVENPFVARVESVRDLLPEFFREKTKSGDWEETTAHGHKHIYDTFAKAHSGSITAITPAQLQAWYDALLARVSASSALTYFACIASFFRWAHERTPRIIAHNPARAVRITQPQPSAERRFANYDLRDKLVASAPNDNLRVFLFLGFHFGLRRREIDHARPEWIDLDRRLLTVRNLPLPAPPLSYFRIKNGKERRIPMSKAATAFFTDYLAQLPADSPYLIEPKKIAAVKNRYRYDMRKPFADHVRSHDAPWLTPQGMRVTFASLLASTGKVTLHQIADWLGDTIKVTERSYAHLLPNHDLIESAFSDR